MKFFEDFNPGDIATFGEYELTKDEIIEFAKKWDPQPFHINEEDAKKSVFEGITASGCQVVSISVLLIMKRDIKVKVLAGLGWDEVRFPAPVRPGDVLSLRHECLEAIDSKSKPDRGIVRNRLTLLNQKDEPVLTYIDTIMVARKNI